MSAMMVMPVRAMMMARDPMMADDARTIHGQHPVAASSSDISGNGIGRRIIVIVGIVVRVVVVVDAADEHAVEMMMEEGMARISRTSRNGRSSRADGATANDGAAERSAAKAAAHAAASANVTTTSTTSATSVTAADLNRQSVDSRLAGNRHSRIERRHRFRAFAGNDRSNQQRRHRAQDAQRTSRTN